jgi:hypothetical protein
LSSDLRSVLRRHSTLSNRPSWHSSKSMASISNVTTDPFRPWT